MADGTTAGDGVLPEPNRRGFLKIMGTAAAAAGATGLPAQRAAAGGLAGDGASLHLDVVDYVDQTYVLAVTRAAQLTGAGDRLSLSDGVQIELTAGQATVWEDRYNRAILLRPGPDEVVAARAVAPPGTVGDTAMSSAEVPVGYDANEFSYDHQLFEAAGGGSCRFNSSVDAVQSLAGPMIKHMSAERRAALQAGLGSAREGQLIVRAAVMGNVIPRSPAEREICWRHARYYGYEQVLGLLRFTYRPDRRSELTMQGQGPGFFPASGVNSLYCRLEMLDVGLAAFNIDPLHLPSDAITWPPYSTPMNLAQPVAFHDETDPDQVLMTIAENEMKLYDYNGITIRLLGYMLGSDGILRGGFEVTNQTDTPFVGRWVLIGDHADRAFASTDSTLDLGPAGTSQATKTIQVQAPVNKSELSQRVAFAVMSLSEPPVLGITPLTFRYPRA